MGNKFRRIRGDLHFQYRFAALYPVAVLEMRRINADPVHEGSVCGTQVAKETLRRRNFQKAMMAREKTVVRQTKLRIFASPDHKGFVLVKRENAPCLRTGDHAQCNSH